MTFESKLNYGKLGESRIAEWLKGRGYSVLPVYELEKSESKGPTLFMPSKVLIAPDMFVFNQQKCFWIEAKHKTTFSWHRLTSRWVTGIDLRHYHDYCIVDDETPFPVWLMFLQEGGIDKYTLLTSPRGLYGNALSKLRTCENHRHANWGRSGMVYWAIDNLVKLSDK